MKTVWFGWLIIGKLLIPPKRGTSNHIFVSFVSKEIKFLSWHGACSVLLATFGRFRCFCRRFFFAPLWHLTSPHQNCQIVTTWDRRGAPFSSLQRFSNSLRQFPQLLSMTPNHLLQSTQSVCSLGKVKRTPSTWGFAVPFSRSSSQTWISLLHLCAIIQF